MKIEFGEGRRPSPSFFVRGSVVEWEKICDRGENCEDRLL